MFAALADPTRRTLLDRLSRLGPQNATELGRGAPMSRQAVAKHLASLEGAGLVTSERHGREVRYQLVRTTVAEATAWLDEVGARWDERLDALRRHLGPP